MHERRGGWTGLFEQCGAVARKEFIKGRRG